METAVLYSGQARTFATCFPNQYWMVLRHLPNPVFYVSVAADEDATVMEDLKTRYAADNVKIEYSIQPAFTEAVELAAKHPHSGYRLTANPSNVMRALWQMRSVWQMASHTVYDLYVRIRPDIYFQEFEMPRAILDNECWVPPWGSYGGINDRFALMGPDAAVKYMNAFNYVDELLAEGCPFHPETIQHAAALYRGGTEVHQKLVADFRFCRAPDADHDNKIWFQPEPLLAIELHRAILNR